MANPRKLKLFCGSDSANDSGVRTMNAIVDYCSNIMADKRLISHVLRI